VFFEAPYVGKLLTICAVCSLGIPSRNGVDELLVLFSVGTPGDGERLTVRCACEGLRSHVGYPDLNGTKSLRAPAVATGANSVARHRWLMEKRSGTSPVPIE
jgi:hypothetical protein